MRNFCFLYAFAIFSLCANGLHGQTSAKRVIVANGGAYSNPADFVTLTAYDLENASTENLATIFTQSIQGLLVHEGIAFVAAQDSLARINIDSGELEAIIALQGVNKFAVYEDKLLVSRQFPVTADFVQVRNIVDLTLVKSFPEVSDESWEIVVAGDSAYVSVAGGWASTEGKMAIIDMANLDFIEEINFGADALGIGPVFKQDNHLIFVCKTPWGGTSGSILQYEINSRNYNTYQIPAALGEAAGIHNGMIYLVLNGNVGAINLGTMSIEDATLIQNPFSALDMTALCIDSINQHIYVNYSYWIAPDGQGLIYDFDGMQVGSYPVGISAEEVAVDYRISTNLRNPATTLPKISVYPNPCTDYLIISDLPETAMIRIFDPNGKKIVETFHNDKSSAKLDIHNLKSGLYFLTVEPSALNGINRPVSSVAFTKR